MLFFQGFSVTRHDFFSSVLRFVERWSRFSRGLGDRGRGCLGDFFHDWSWFDSRRLSGSSGSLFGFLLQTLGFTLATTHFTRIVRRAAICGQGAGRCWLFNRGRCFDNHGCFDHWSRLDHFWLDRFHGFWCRFWLDNRCRCNWLGGPVERSLLLAGRLWGLFLGRCFEGRLSGYHWLLDDRCRLGDHFSFSNLGFMGRGDFHFWRSSGFYRSSGFDYRSFSNWRAFHGSGSAFGLFVSLGFGRGADCAAGNGGSHGQAGGQVGSAWRFSVLGGLGLFRTFDHVAVGVTLTLTTVAATTLATGAAAWTIAFGGVLAVFLQLLFGVQHFFFAGSGGCLLGAWLALFTWRTRCTFFTRLASRTLFSGGGGGSRGGIQWLAQFANTFFTLATWLAIFTRIARMITLLSW